MKRTYIVPQIEIEELDSSDSLLGTSDKSSGSGDGTIGNDGRDEYENGWGIGPGTGGALAKGGHSFFYFDDEEEEFYDDEEEF